MYSQHYIRYTVLLALVISLPGLCQLLQEDFEYDPGTVLNTTDWIPYSNAGVNAVTVTEPGLSYPGYPPSGRGNAVSLGSAGGEDLFRQFSAQTTGTVYAACMVNISAAQLTGDAFFHLFPLNATLSVGRVFGIMSPQGGLEFGLQKSLFPPKTLFTRNGYTFNTTYLVVLKYEILPGTNNDEVSLFVITGQIPTVEPGTPTLGALNEGPDPVNIGAVAIRQGNSAFAPATRVDGIAVTQTWGDLPLPVSLSAFSAAGEENQVRLSWRTESEINNLGFRILRATTSEGPYDIISSYEYNESLAGQFTSNTPHDYSFIDRLVVNGSSYWYFLQDVDVAGNSTDHGPVFARAGAADETVPEDIEIYPAFPNPFNPETTFRIQVRQQAIGLETGLNITIYNVAGQRVRHLVDNIVSLGVHDYTWDARNDRGAMVGAGLYIAEIRVNGRTDRQKVILTK